jgi:recombination protein RecR
MNSADIQSLIQLLAKLPGLGPRSGRRVALHLIKKKNTLLEPLSAALIKVAQNVRTCSVCGNLDSIDPCSICADTSRDTSICVVEEVDDLWALERTSVFRGKYHVLGGVLSALEGIGPEDLNIVSLLNRMRETSAQEVILALNATVDGLTTAHYIQEKIEPLEIKITRLAHGVPVGGELDYLDEGTLSAALRARRPM